MTSRISSPPPRDDPQAADRTGSPTDVRLTFEQAPVALVGLYGPDHTVIAANAAYRAILGHHDIIGRPVREEFPEAAGQQIFEIIDRIYDTGDPVIASGWRYQLDVDGSGVTTDLYLDFAGGPLRDAQGQIVGTYFSVGDATERVLVQQRKDEDAALTRQQYAEAIDVITQLQGALLPSELPLLPGLDIAGSYLLAASDTAAGGDWFDALTRHDGRAVAVVGDVVGHGVAASAVMGQLRAVLHERLIAGAALPDALAALDRYARTLPAAHAATVCAVEIDPRTGSLTYCTAGHPPPLLITAGSGTRYLEPTGAGPLATGSRFTVTETELGLDDVLLLFTDGILERPGVPWARASVELSQVATDAAHNHGLVRGASPRATDRICQIALELLTRESGHGDDITLLALQRTPFITPLQLRLPARPESVSQVRAGLADWLDAVGARTSDALAVQHATIEIVTNAVVHAYRDDPEGSGRRDEPAAIDLRIGLGGDGTVTGVVADHGRWRTSQQTSALAPARDGGRGLAMTAAFVDDLDLNHDGDGTTVTFRHRLTRSARVSANRHAAPEPTSVVDEPFDIGYPETGLTVSGPVDLLSAGLLRDAVLRRSLGLIQPIVIDLDHVTHLASVGVQVLYEAHAAGVTELRAGWGTPAQQVLELVRLPYAEGRRP